MNIKVRRLIMFLFILAFVIVGPILLLYASGYRYDIKRGMLFRTGNIFIEAPDIRLADVYVNNELYQEPLTKKLFIKNLLPGEYTVRVEKEGYYSWEQELTVQPTLTTFIIDLVLFTKNNPEILVSDSVSKIETSPDEQKVAYVKDVDGISEIYLYNMRTGDHTLMYRTSSQQYVDINWSPSSRRVLISQQTNAIVVSATAPYESIELTNDASQEATWVLINDSDVFMVRQDGIYRERPEFDEFTQIYTPDEAHQLALTVEEFKDNLYFIEQTPQGSELRVLNYRTGNWAPINTLSRSSGYAISDVTDQHLLITNNNLSKVYLVRKPVDQSQNLFSEDIITFDANCGIFNNTNSQIILYSDFELKLFDLTSSRLRLINRFSQPIEQVIWYEDYQHIIIDQNQSLIISDLNQNAEVSQSIAVLSEIPVIDFELIDDDLLLYASDAPEPGLYTLEIK